MDGHCFLFRNVLAEFETLIRYIPILSTLLRKLAWMTLVAETARPSKDAGKKRGTCRWINELIILLLQLWRIEGKMHSFVSRPGKIPWITNLGFPCCVHLSGHWMLTEAILQIYVPQDHQILNHKNDTANEFPPTARLCSSPKAINSIERQWKFMQGKTGCFSLQTSAKLEKQVCLWALDLHSGRSKSSQGFLFWVL